MIDATQQCKRSQDEGGRGLTEWVWACRHHDGITSAILVGAHLVRHAPAACQQELWQGFVAAAWPWTMWHHHAIRSVAHLLPLHCHLCRFVLLSHMSCPILYPWIRLCTVQSLLVSFACGKLSYPCLDLQAVTPFAHSVKIVSGSCSCCSSLLLHGPALQLA